MAKTLLTQTYSAISDYLAGARTQAIQLLQVNGVDISQGATESQLQIAFLTAIKNSNAFRTQAASSMAQYFQSPTATRSNAVQNFIDNSGYLNDAGGGIDSILSPGDPGYYGSDPLVGPTDTTTDSSVDDLPIAQAFDPNSLKPVSQSTPIDTTVLPSAAPNSISNTLLNPKAVQNDVVNAPSTSTGGLTGLLQSGLNLVSSKISADAQKSTNASAVQLAQAQLAAKALQPTTSGSTLTTVLIIVAVVGVLGGVGYAIFHKSGKK